MTAEIAILNKNAIALAADSAVTIGARPPHKIFNTAEKLFSLSKYHPVGVMIYDSATIMGIPWESVIKVYRTSLRKKSFRTLKEYADDFLKFLGMSKSLFPAAVQVEHFEQRTAGAFHRILENIGERVKSEISANKSASPTKVKEMVASEIEAFHKDLMAARILPHVSRDYFTRLKRRYSAKINKIRAIIFEKIPVSPKHLRMLSKIAIQITGRDVFPFENSGLVIAGFGETEIFPSVREYQLCSILDGVLKFKDEREVSITIDNGAAIIPFAQREMVSAFMEGADPSYQQAISAYLKGVLESYPGELLKQVSGISDAKRKSLASKFQKIRDKVLEDFKKRTFEFRQKNHIRPVVTAISFLPKDMLAEVAESLVNLTSFKRRISLNAPETVGGPIDVAVISRGDGFVWIKRKHYFKADLNPHFFKNYFGEHHENA